MFHPPNPGSFVKLSKHYEQNLCMYICGTITASMKILIKENRAVSIEDLIKVQK